MASPGFVKVRVWAHAPLWHPLSPHPTPLPWPCHFSPSLLPKDKFITYMQAEAVRRENRTLMDNRSKFLPVHVHSGHLQSLRGRWKESCCIAAALVCVAHRVVWQAETTCTSPTPQPRAR